MQSETKARNAMAASQQPEQDTAPKALRTWTITLGICAALLVTMYGLAFWHEAQAEAARTAPATVSTPVH
jgi:type VI protein secretion system component VasF